MVTKFACPYCNQTSSRAWNLEIHMKRKHGTVGKPIVNDKNESLSRASTRDKSRNENKYKSSGHQTICRPRYVDSQIQAPTSQTDSMRHPCDPTSLIRNTVEWIKPFVEFKRILRSIGDSSTPTSNYPIPLLPLPQTLDQECQLPVPGLAPCRAANKGTPFGFRIRICEACLTNTFHVVRYVREAEIHLCNQADLRMNRTLENRFEVFTKLTNNSGNLLFTIISKFQSPRYDLVRALRLNDVETQGIDIANPLKPSEYLSIFSENERCIELDLNGYFREKEEVTSHDWLKRVIDEGWAELEKNDLFAYLQLIRTATFAFFRTKYGNRIRRYFIYLIGR